MYRYVSSFGLTIRLSSLKILKNWIMTVSEGLHIQPIIYNKIKVLIKKK